MKPSKQFSHKLALIEPQSEEEAIALMMSGFIYFLQKHRKKTLFVIFVFLIGAGVLANDYVSMKFSPAKIQQIEKKLDK